jgi:hypothetical protein
MKANQVVNYALGLLGLGVVVYVAGRAWKASKSSTLGDKVVGAVEGVVESAEGAVTTGNVTTGETGGAASADVVAQEESNFAGASRGVIVTDSRGGWSDASPFMGTPVM